MSPTDAPVAPWVEPYLPDFRALLRVIERSPGFVLQPVVLPSPDLARALADWLTTQNVTLRAIDLRHGAWDDLAARLASVSFGDAPRPRAVVVITPHDLDPAAIDRGLAALNSQRDMLARHLGCPLLWCGSTDLLRATADHASDFWSIANPPHRIPPRDLAAVPRHWGDPRAWWTNAIQHEEPAADSEAPLPLGAEFQRAETLVVQGDHADALALLQGLEDSVRRDAPSLVLRWNLLAEAALAAAHGNEDAISLIRRGIDDSHARRGFHTEASLRRALGYMLRHLDPPTARGELQEARRLFLSLGDDKATASVERELISEVLAPLPPGLSDSILEHARSLLDTMDEQLRLSARILCTSILLGERRLDEASEFASQAHDIAVRLDLLADQYLVLSLQDRIADARGSLDERLRIQSEILALTGRLALPSATINALVTRGQVFLDKQQFDGALQDFAEAIRLCRAVGNGRLSAVLVLMAAHLYLCIGRAHIAEFPYLRGLLELLHLDSSKLAHLPLPDLPDEALTSGLIGALCALHAWQRDFETSPASPSTRERLNALERFLEDYVLTHQDSFAVRGMDWQQPSTWPPLFSAPSSP